MKQRAKPLTAIAVANARCPRNQPRIEFPDGGCRGLYLVVQNSGAKSWACRYRPRRSRKSRKLTLGDVFLGEGEPTTEPAKDTPLTLAAARLLAATALLQVQAGRDPAAEKRAKREAEDAAKADTLEAVAEEFLRREFAKKRTFNQRKADLELLYKPLGALSLEAVTRGEFARAFDRIADDHGKLRRDRVLGAAKRLLTWHASRSDYRPVLGRESKRLVSIREGARARILDDGELRKVWLAAEQPEAGVFGAYIRFLLLTATRRKEAAAMQRSEREDSATWIIPWERYKTGDKSKTDMLVPLSKAAQDIVDAQPKRGEFIFSSTGERPLTNFAVNKARFDTACGVTGWTIHDLRRTARTLLSKLTTPDIAERCLGHILMGQRGVYDRASYQDEKRAAFEALAQLIDRIVHPTPEATVADFAKERGKRRR
jgi:hypothetical protein